MADRTLPVHESCSEQGCGICQSDWPCARLARAQRDAATALTDKNLDKLKHDYWWLDANHSRPWIPFARAVLERYGNHTREENLDG